MHPYTFYASYIGSDHIFVPFELRPPPPPTLEPKILAILQQNYQIMQMLGTTLKSLTLRCFTTTGRIQQQIHHN